jgi:hypothetical protein
LLENAVQSLLERNRKALERLYELQIKRLCQEDAPAVEEGSEEWETGTYSPVLAIPSISSFSPTF